MRLADLYGIARFRSRGERRPRLPTTNGFAALHDHARLPWRFFGRFTASAEAQFARH
jgi:hypothetical protein